MVTSGNYLSDLKATPSDNQTGRAEKSTQPRLGFEPATFGLLVRCSHQLSYEVTQGHSLINFIYVSYICMDALSLFRKYFPNFFSHHFLFLPQVSYTFLYSNESAHLQQLNVSLVLENIQENFVQKFSVRFLKVLYNTGI